MNKKRHAGCVFVACLIGIFLGPGLHGVAPQWIQLQSANFVLTGDADEGDLRNVAGHLEEFREALSTMLPNARFDRTPTIVVVFANERGYRPVTPTFRGKAIEEAPGFAVPGRDVNYVVMVLGRQIPFPLVFHEFTHLFVHANMGDVPLWFEEGLAEYYSSFEVAGDGKHANVGRPIAHHVQLLRDRWVPLDQVLATNHDSPLYNVSNNRPVFYAESWAWVHYLLNGGRAKATRPQLFQFLARLAVGTPREQACNEAFGVPIAGMEKEVRQYVQQAAFEYGVMTYEQPVAARTKAPAQPISEAAAEARVGDVLMNMNRLDEAEPHLQNALRLDPNQALAHLSLGEMRLRQHREAEGLKYLERATTLDPNSFQAHATYGLALMRRASGEPTREAIEAARKAYARALEIRPDSPEAMGGLAWALFLSDQHLDEAQRLAERAMAADPGEPDYVLLLAQLHANQRDFAGARALVGPLLASSRTEVREQARTLMARIGEFEQATAPPPGMERVVGIRRPGPATGTESSVIDTPPTGKASYTLHLRAPKEGEQRVFGSLERIECTPSAVIFHVKSGDRTMRVSTAKFDGVEFITYRNDLKGDVGCGARTPADPVYATFRPAAANADGAAKSHGEIVAVEFVPRDYVPKK